MADFCCRFQSLASTHNIRSSLPSKHYYYSPAHVLSFNFRAKVTQSLPLTLPSKPSRPTPLASDLDVVSTHEHSDGSLLFRFGDPSEVAKNVEIEESKIIKEEIKSEGGIDGYTTKVFDEKEMMITEKADKEMALVDEEIGSHEKLLERKNDIDLEIVISSTETEVSLSTPLAVQIEDHGNVDKGLNEENVNSSALRTSILDNITKVEFLEDATANYVTSSSGVNIELDGNVVEYMNEEHKNSSIDMENKITTTTLKVLETESTEVVEDSLIPVSENDDFESNNVTKDVPGVLDHRNVESEVHNEITEDGIEVNDEFIEASVDELTELNSASNSHTLMTNFVLSSGVALLKHPSKALTGGEDAYFVAGETWIGVADGVGQWSLQGTNHGAYAQELVKSCERLVSDCSTGESVNTPLELLNLSVTETISPGSSTVLIAQLDGQALNVANIGDSGFIILRKGSVYKRSSPMHHAFHFPLRVERGDNPSSLAELYRVDLEEEDVIITATDGLLDNLYFEEISSIVLESLDADKRLEEIAELLAKKAEEIGMSESTRSPFSDDARAAGFAKYSGGKLDSVAVIVSVVKRQ